MTVSLFKFLTTILPAVISVAFLTLMERKILGIVGYRLGPNKVSLAGILQPIVDALKLMNKQSNNLMNFSVYFYYASSLVILFSSLTLWFCLPASPCPISLKFSILIFMILLSVNSLNSIMLGWSTFGKYSLIGSLRTVSQLISYEAVLYLALFMIMAYYCSFSLSSMEIKPIAMIALVSPMAFFMWIPSVLAELNRSPFDFSEGESELVSGYNTEFGSMGFTMIFLSEYSNILFMSMITSILFFYFYQGVLSLYSMFFFIWIRSVLPRFRFDKLMMLCWKSMIPILTLMFMILVTEF